MHPRPQRDIKRRRATSGYIRPWIARTGQPTAVGEPPGCYGLIYLQPGSRECKMGTGQPRITKTEYYALTTEGRLEQPTRNAYTVANTLCVAPTQRGSTLSIYTLRATFLPACSLPTGTDNATQPTRHQQPPTARAPAGHFSQNRSRCRRTPATPRMPSPRSSEPSRTYARLSRPSVQQQHACNQHSSSVSTQIGSGIASQ